MGLRLNSQPFLFALAAGALFCAPSMAIAQNEKDAAKDPPSAEKIAEWKKDAEERRLFTDEKPLEIKLVGNYKVISKDRDTLSTKEYWGLVQMDDGKGGEAACRHRRDSQGVRHQ
jgi:hypothetical protein